MGIPVREIKGIGEKTEKLLAKLDIETVDQLVHHYPRCYTTYPEPISISEIKTGQRCSIEAEIASPIHLKTVRKLKLCTGLIADVSGQLFVRWFNMPYLRNTLKQGEQWIFTGTPIYKDGRLMLEQPEYCKREKYLQLMETFQPIYPLTTGLSNKTVQKAQAAAFEMYREEEYLPETVRNYYDLEPVNTALREVHFPTGTEHLMEAKKRIIFDEFFRFFSALELVKDREEQALNHYIIPMEEPVKRFVENLPYPLTGAQKKVLNEIRQDFSDTMAMNRLLQGDVGSGKTIVAMTAMYAAVLAGYQAALMAPTEVLAEQHYQNFVKLLSPLGITVALLTGSTKAKEKREIKAACASGEIQILIGTHAVIQDDVAFDNLAFIVTDEQHRFGVKQRDAFMKKGKTPMFL
ncbi:DEAD/DEAH box helicase [Anaerobutyricum hallii]|nr:DEAD/DEAH box helicase [Anaerobutyricum hallii]